MRRHLYILPVIAALGWVLALSARAQVRSNLYYTGAPPNVAPTATPSPYATVLPPASWIWNGVQGAIPANILPTANQPLYYVPVPSSIFNLASKIELTYNYVDPHPFVRGLYFLAGGDKLVTPPTTGATYPGTYMATNANIPGIEETVLWRTLDPGGPGTTPGVGGVPACNTGTYTGHYCWGEIDLMFGFAANNNKSMGLSIVFGERTPKWVDQDIVNNGGKNFNFYEYEGFPTDDPNCTIETIPQMWHARFQADAAQLLTDLANHLATTQVGNVPVFESTLFSRLHYTGAPGSVTEEMDEPIDRCWPWGYTGGGCTPYLILNNTNTCGGSKPACICPSGGLVQQNPNGIVTSQGTPGTTLQCGDGTHSCTDQGLNTEWSYDGWTPSNITTAFNSLLASFVTTFGPGSSFKVPIQPMAVVWPTGLHGTTTAGVVGLPGINSSGIPIARTDSTTMYNALNTWIGPTFPSSTFNYFMLQQNAVGSVNGVAWPFTGLNVTGEDDIGYQTYGPLFAKGFFPSSVQTAVQQGAQEFEMESTDAVSGNGANITEFNIAMQFPSGSVNLINLGSCGTAAAPVVPQHVPNFTSLAGTSTGQWCYDVNNAFGNNVVGSTVDIYTSENPGYAGGATPITLTIHY